MVSHGKSSNSQLLLMNFKGWFHPLNIQTGQNTGTCFLFFGSLKPTVIFHGNGRIRRDGSRKISRGCDSLWFERVVCIGLLTTAARFASAGLSCLDAASARQLFSAACKKSRNESIIA